MQAVTLSLDPGTFLFFLSIFGLFMSGISFSASTAVSTNIEGLKDWGRAMLFMGITFMLFFLRNAIHGFYSIFLANLMIFMSGMYALTAYCKYYRIKMPYKTLMVAVGIGVCLVCLSFWEHMSSNLTVIGVSLPMSLIAGMIVYNIYKHHTVKKSPAAWLSMTSLGLLSLALLTRVFMVLVGNSNSAQLFAKSNTQIGFFIAVAFTVAAASIGFILMVHEKQKHEIIESSKRDGLTGLYTRTAFFESAGIIDSVIPKESYSVLMVDIDFFKKINDTYGHAAGDVAIIQLARLLAKNVRSCDLVGRYGGEEFCLLLRNTSPQDTEKFAKRLVEAASKEVIALPHGQQISFTISIGYTQRTINVEEQVLSIKDLLDRADQALYEAKRSGRNCALPAL